MTRKPLSPRSSRHLARLVLALLAAALLLLAQRPSTANAYPLWTLENVAYTYGPIDMVLGADDTPYLAYVDHDLDHHVELRFAVRDGSGWRVETVASASYCPHLDGVNLSLAYNANADLTAISFYDHCEQKYRVAIGNQMPPPFEYIWSWTLEEPPNWQQGNFDDEHYGSDIAIDDQGNIHLVTIDDVNVHYIKRATDGSYQSASIPQWSDYIDGFVQDVSIALGPDNRPYVVSDTVGNQNILRYSYQSLPFHVFTTEQVTTDQSGGLGHALVIDNSGIPWIAFHDGTSLKLAHRTTTSPILGTWAISTVDAGASCDAGRYPSLALDDAGNTHIGYHCQINQTHGSVRYAYENGAAWQIEEVDATYLENEWTALALDESGAVHMSYQHYFTQVYATRAEVPPTAFIDSHPPLNDPLTTATFTFHSNDAAATFKCRLDSQSAAFTACASPQSYSNLTDGSHTFQVVAMDAAGRISPTPAEYTWTVDTLAPDTTLMGKPSNPSNSSSATFTFSSGEAGATFECRLDSAAFAACASPQSAGNLADGSHTFSVQARDAAGNVDPTPATVTWTIDTVVPDTTLDATPPNPSTSSSATFAFSSDESGATFACKLDGGDYGPCVSPKSYSNLTDGSHTFVVRAGDAAGNLDASPAGYTWTLDATPPNTTITTKPAALSNDPTPDFAFTSNEGSYGNGVYFYCQTDANNWFLCGGDSITYHNLFDGDHTFRVKAEDALGNVDPTPATWSWTMDLTPPVTTLTTTPPNPSASKSASFAFSSEDGATFECKLDSGSYAACTSPKSYTGLSEAGHTFQARATDAAGNVGNPAGYTWAIDTVAPETTITGHPDVLTNSATASFSFTGDGAASFECKLDAAAFVACASPVNYTNLYNGSHAFHVRATDAAGNTDPSPADYTWTVDTNPPETTLTGWPQATTNSTSATFTFTGDGAASFECKLDTSNFSLCASPNFYEGLPNGSHTFQVRAKDAAGNVDPSPAGYTWTVDTIPPDMTLTGTPPNPSNSGSATFTFSSETGVTFQCKLDFGEFAACASPQSYSNLTDGLHAFAVLATDAAGNSADTPAAYAWIVDTVAPETTIDTWIGDIYTVDTLTIEFSSSEANSAFACQLDSGGWAACTSPITYTGLADGPHTFGVRATDAAGNTDPTPADFTWTIDTIGPQTTINSGPSGITGDNDPSFGFSSETGATFKCQMDSDPFATCTSPWPYTNLSDGPHTFRVRATDAAGNTGPTAERAFTVDSAAPSVSIDTHPPALTNSNAADFIFSGETGATLACKLDGGAFAACDSPERYTGLADGEHTFTVRATDAAGNNAEAAYTWTVDTAAPVVTITSGPSDPSPSPDASFTFTSETGATFACRLDGGAWAGCDSPKSYTGLSEGSHTFEARATDAAGNTGPADSHTWTIELPLVISSVYVTATGGHIANGPTYQKNDILKWDGSAWSVWFDGAAEGLPAAADIMAFDVADDAGAAWMTIRQAAKLPGLGKAQPNQIVYSNGATTWSLFFDGGDVGLKTSGEHINGLEVLPGSASPIGNGCQYYLLISTVAGGGVPVGSTNVNFTGEDVLGFCMTSGGANTVGTWHVAFEGQAEGLQKNNNYGLSANDDATTLYFTAKKSFSGDGGLVKPSELFSWSDGVFSGPLWKAADHGLNQVVDGIDVGN